MIKFFKGLKRAADFFSIHPDGLSFVTERRLKDVEASVRRLPQASRKIMDWSSFEPVYESLTHDLGEMNVNIHSILRRLDNRQEPHPTQLSLLAEQVKSTKKPKAVKLKPVEEEVKKVKSTLTQAKVKRLFEYRDGELYWKVNVSYKVRKGDKAGYAWSYDGYTYKSVSYKSRCYTISRLIFLMFYGYMPEYVTYIDGNSLNTRIENLRAATHSQIMTCRGIRKNNTSGFKGVKYSKNDHKWIAAISKNKKYYHLGSFDAPEEAYKAYCKAAKKLHGEFAQVT